MATGEPTFACHDLTITSVCLHVLFRLEIRKFLKDDNGNIVAEEALEEVYGVPEFLFGSDRHRQQVTARLIQAGWSNPDTLQRSLDAAFSTAMLHIERVKTTRLDDTIPTVSFRVDNFVRLADVLEARALELSMQQVPKPVPATKESIGALKKVKLEGDIKEECVICMEQLCSGAEKVITSMPCSHLFHGDCIEKWLNTSHMCPLCRFPMPTDA